MTDTPQKNQHYLPKGIIKAFGLGKKNRQIFFINKRFNRIAEKTNIKNVACINNFYNFENKNDSLEIDFFGKIDSAGAEIVSSLLKTNDFSGFDKNRIEKLSLFVASQICRVPCVYNNLNALETAFKTQISKDVEIFSGGAKDFFLEQIKASSELYKTLLLKKKIKIFQIKNEEFVIGDNPVVMQGFENEIITDGRYAAAINARIFMMPISPTRILIFFDEWTPEEIHGHLSCNNDWQFINSTEYVFGHTKESLENGLKKYHENSYKYIESLSPHHIKDHNLIKGDPIFIEWPQYSFEGSALDAMRKMVKNGGFKSNA